MVKDPPASAGDAGSIPGSRRSPGGGHGNPLQYSCLENSLEGFLEARGQRSLADYSSGGHRESGTIEHYINWYQPRGNNVSNSIQTQSIQDL